MINQPLTAQDLVQLEQANYRRITLLTTLVICSVYVLLDLALYWGEFYGIEFLLRFSAMLPASTGWQIVIFIGSLLLVWIAFYSFDDGFEQARERSWLYQIGNVDHLRPFNILFLLGLIVALALAARYRVVAGPFWLFWSLLLLTTLVNFIEDFAVIGRRFSRAGMRLRLLFVRLPLIGRLISLRPINRRLQAGVAPPDPPAAVQPPDAAPAQPPADLADQPAAPAQPPDPAAPPAATSRPPSS